MTADVPVRAATAADLPAIRALADATPNAPCWTEAQYTDFLALTPQDAARQHIILVALLRTELAGFCVMRSVAGEAELESIVVASASRRRGIGKTLSLAAIAWAQDAGASQVWLEVRASNNGAIALYRAIGFAETGHRRSYYRDPVEDAVLMRADLEATTHLQ